MTSNVDVPMATIPTATESAPPERYVDCVAPASLPGGYALNVDVDGKPAVVLVPNGGVNEGQNFRGKLVGDGGGGGGGAVTGAAADVASSAASSIPVGNWRDGICDCFAHGICHPMLCLALWCTPCALGQVMTREGLAWTSRPAPPGGPEWTAFKVLFATTALFCFLYTMANLIKLPLLSFLLEMGFFILVLVLTINTRSYIRHKYAIPEKSCAGCEDCCCSFWCNCCTITQMARHTADYEKYPAECCSDTGISSVQSFSSPSTKIEPARAHLTPDAPDQPMTAHIV